MVVDLEYLGRPSFMPLFVALRPGALGAELGQVASPDAMQNPSSLDFSAEYAKAIPHQR
jgi:hypothetical protein